MHSMLVTHYTFCFVYLPNKGKTMPNIFDFQLLLSNCFVASNKTLTK